ncbi:MAG TPA: hypothetical protein VH276_05010 [Solirubrobacteraceae bacterium]|jgi:hypothetical protein|nr:hypothetical protein [Solirubrobacteraceae bacterium]
MTEDTLDALSSKQLHDMAVSRARHHLDVKFFWELIRTVPAAEAAAGDLNELENDMQHLGGHLDDVTEAGEGELAELLRPLYLDYLRRHGVTGP